MTSDAMTTALNLHQAGRLQEAEQIYKQILLVEPSHPGALHYFGVLAYQRGEHEIAVECIKRTLAVMPDYAEAHSNLGLALVGLGKFDEGIARYQKAIDLRPDYPEAHCNLGCVLRAQGRLDEAATHFRKAIRLRPEYPEAYDHLGVTLTSQGKLDEAITCFRRAQTLSPGYAEAYHNLGFVFQKQGKTDQAIACFHQALQLKPSLVEPLNSLGAALQESGKPDEAIDCLKRALTLKPDYANAHNNLGNALKDQAKLEEAIACYRRATELQPDFVCAHNNLLYAMYFCPGYDRAKIYEEHRRWSRQQCELLSNHIHPHSNDRSTTRRLRIGYVSPNFRNHVLSFFLVPLFEQHDQKQFQVFCYSFGDASDDITARLRKKAAIWRTITGLSDDQAAQQIRQDQIDVLVDLTMHMADARPLIFARKPAPVQVCWLAYPGTTGLSTMDYRLADPYLDPPGLDDAYYSEETFRLPDSFWCYDPLGEEPAVNSLPALDKGYVTFGSLNNFSKLNLSVLMLWSRVLKATDNSRLVMLSPEGSHRQWVQEVLQTNGVAIDRVTFVAKQPRQKYFELYHTIDIGLDPVPYNGHTTSLDALWMGVPVVTLVGQTVVGRAGVCQLNNIGLPELIAESDDEYIRKATELAGDLVRLRQLRETLRERMRRSPLMDAPRFARGIESAYRNMWQRWCAKGTIDLH